MDSRQPKAEPKKDVVDIGLKTAITTIVYEYGEQIIEDCTKANLEKCVNKLMEAESTIR